MSPDLSTVDLKERGGHPEIEALEFGQVELLEDIVGCHGVNTLLAVLRAALEVSPHRMRLAAASLSVGETRCHPTLKNKLHQWLGCEPRVPRHLVYPSQSFLGLMQYL